MANQEFKGIKKAVQQRIEGLKNFKQEPGLFISEQLISELAYITSETQREVCVYITRSGEIIFSSIGERDRVSLENMSMRRSEQRLSGFRCIHTHTGGSDMLSEVDIQSLKSLRLDAMAAIGVKDGRAGYISAAVLESIEGELRPKFMRSPSWNLPHEQWMQAIMEADRAIVKSRVYQTAPQKERVMLLGHGDLAELEALTLTAGGEICARVVQKNKPLGEGKLKQAALEAQAARAQLIIYDGELSPSRQHELEERFSLPVIDRTALILDIFAMRARSGEGQLQVELAQCKYALSRLTGQGVQLSRQGGGIGTRGPGEKKLESDRRHLKRREAELEKQLEQLSSRRSLMRRKRKRSGMPLISLIGYTNAGKSTLLQIIAGTLAPTTGSVRTCGRVAALLELGSGFNPEFTGRENVFLNAAILGLSDVIVDIVETGTTRHRGLCRYRRFHRPACTQLLQRHGHAPGVCRHCPCRCGYPYRRRGPFRRRCLLHTKMHALPAPVYSHKDTVFRQP